MKRNSSSASSSGRQQLVLVFLQNGVLDDRGTCCASAGWLLLLVDSVVRAVSVVPVVVMVSFLVLEFCAAVHVDVWTRVQVDDLDDGVQRSVFGFEVDEKLQGGDQHGDCRERQCLQLHDGGEGVQQHHDFRFEEGNQRQQVTQSVVAVTSPEDLFSR